MNELLRIEIQGILEKQTDLDVKIYNIMQLIQQERVKAQLEVIHKIEDVVYTSRLIDVINELKQSLAEKEEKW